MSPVVISRTRWRPGPPGATYVPPGSPMWHPSRYYAPRAIDGPFFPRLKFFRTGGHESAPRVQFCAARPGIRRSRVSSPKFSPLYLKERRFLAEKYAIHLGGQNFDQMKRQKRPRGVAQAVLPKGNWILAAADKWEYKSRIFGEIVNMVAAVRTE